MTSNTFIHDFEGSLSCLATNNNSSMVVAAGRNVLQVFKFDATGFSPMQRIKQTVRPSAVCDTTAKMKNISDIAWCLSDESVLATGTTNGEINVWDMSRNFSEKAFFSAHTRTIHRVLFHPTSPQEVLSASQDGAVRLFDLRDKNRAVREFVPRTTQCPLRDMAFCPNQGVIFATAQENGHVVLWDVRQEGRSQRVVNCHACSIMSIDWHPQWTADSRNWLATAGSRDHLIRVLDLGQAGAPPTIYMVRTSNVSRIRWRPDSDTQLASSCNLTIDLSIHVWDLERPYIPYATFEGHRDLVTAIAWSNDRSVFFTAGKDGLLIGHNFKDAIRLVENANPITCDISPRGTCAISVCQDRGLGAATLVPVVSTVQALAGSHMIHNVGSSTRLPSVASNLQIKSSHEFLAVTSLLFQAELQPRLEHRNLYETLLPDMFVFLATNYRLSGGTVAELCEYNSEMAASCKQALLSQFWSVIKCVFGSNSVTNSNAHVTKDQSVEKGELEKVRETNKQTESERDSTVRDRGKPDTSTGNTDDSNDYQTDDDWSNLASLVVNEPADFLFSDGQDSDLGPAEDSGFFYFNHYGQQTPYDVPSERGRPHSHTTCAQNQAATEQSSVAHSPPTAHDITGSYRGLQSQTSVDELGFDVDWQNWKLDDPMLLNCRPKASEPMFPKEAFQPRHDIVGCMTVPIGTGTSTSGEPQLRQHHRQRHRASSTSQTPTGAGTNLIIQAGAAAGPRNAPARTPFERQSSRHGKPRRNSGLREPSESSDISLVDMTPPPPPQPCDLSCLVVQWLPELVEQGCVQTVCSALLVLGDRLRIADWVEERQVENWFLIYLELLSRFSLWTVASRIIKLCPYPAVSSLSQQSTTLVTKCGRCNKVLDRHGAFCHRHNDVGTVTCAVCHLTVRGIFLWCQGCSHGGHIQHIAEWLKRRADCPTGCGHRCEFT